MNVIKEIRLKKLSMASRLSW